MATGNTIDVSLRYTVDASKATADTRSFAQEVQRLDKATQEAHRSLTRMATATSPGGTYALAGGNRGPGGYGFAGMPQGQSAASAFSHSVAAAGMPAYQPGAYPGGPPPGGPPRGPGGPYGGGARDPMGEWSQLFGKAAATAGSIMALAGAIDRLGQTADRVRYSTDPSGQRLSPRYAGLKTGIDTLTDLPIIGYGLKAGAGATEYLIDQGATGLAGFIPGLQPGQRRAAQSYLRNAQLAEAMVGPSGDAERRIRDYKLAAQTALFGGEAYEQFRTGEEGRRAQTLALMQFSPELAAAGMNERRAQANYGAASKSYAAAGGEAAFYGERQQRLQMELAAMQTGGSRTGPIDVAFSSLAPGAAMNVDSQRLAIQTKMNELAKANADLQDALNRKQEAGLQLAQQKQAVDQASLALNQTKLSVADAELNRAAGFGTSSPLDQLSALNIARKLKAGGPSSLTMDEQQFALGNNLLGAFAAREIGTFQVNNNAVLQEIYQLTGQLDRLNLAKQRDVLLDANFKLALAEGEAAKIGADIVNQILPQLVNAVNADLQQRGRGVEIQLNNAQAVEK
jgi:hypothetical protein